MNKEWSILVHLSMNMWKKQYTELEFDDSVWDYILEESVKSGVNMIVLDVGDGVAFASHPEIAIKGAWPRSRVRKEVARCKELGIELIPKLNFSATHDLWLGEYERMVSTSTYYKVCADLIHEVYELFDKPKYIHLGMDEEDAKHQRTFDFVAYRQGDLYWHDLRFLLDCVTDTGAKPWIWNCPLRADTEGFWEHISADEVLISPWYYLAIKEEHYTPIDCLPMYEEYYGSEDYAGMGLKFVEEDPDLAKFRETVLPQRKDYTYAPCVSVYNRCVYNTEDMVEYFKENVPDEKIAGYMTAPWCSTTEKHRAFFEESFMYLKAAKEKFYP